MVTNHWSYNGMVTIQPYGLLPHVMIKKWICEQLYNFFCQENNLYERWPVALLYRFSIHSRGRKEKVFCLFAKFCDWLIKLVRRHFFGRRISSRLLHQCKNIGAFTELWIFAKYLESWKYVWWMCALNLQIHIYVWNSQSKYLKGCLRWDYMCVTTCCVKR